MKNLNWDRDFALEQAAEDSDLLNELVEIFKDSSKKDLDIVKEGIAEDNCEKIAGAAHSIKGAAASLGMLGIQEIAKKMEEECRSGNIMTSVALLPDLEDLFEQLQQL